ncbi:MAG: EAL domain-containing protein (putative c-di-GMP-specific phosphodiesterase class I) [Phenylobacterium sp.]|jgi:EAL domain-containing protein (putative c-di-GMP-specific phosphodiesterase class I)/CheY-like chemotaxis protein
MVQGEQTKNKIFIVDDNPANTTMLSQVVEEEGFGSIFVFNDPEVALAEFHRQKPDLVLLDLLMPKISGIEFLQQIEKQIKNAEVAVIVLTASQNEANKMDALSMGAQDYIAKPLNIIETLQRIHNVFNLQKSKNSFQNLSKDLDNKLERTRSDLSDVILTLNAIFKNSSEYVFITDDAGLIIDCNAAAIKCFDAQSLAERGNLFKYFGIDDLSSLKQNSELALTDGIGKRIIVEASYSQVVINAMQHTIFIFNDITTRKEDEINLRFLSENHYITHLPNRNQLQRLVQAKAQDLAGDLRLSFIFISFVENNKEVEVFGHQRLECLLLNIALALVKLAGHEKSVLIHWGDNDFLLVEESSKASDLIGQVLARFDDPIRISDANELTIYSKPILGVAQSDEISRVDHSELEGLVDNALLATCDGARRNCRLNTYDRVLHDKISYQALIEKELIEAIKHDGFKVAYQPKVDLNTGKIIGAEALARWHNDTLGTVGPNVFIPIAENAGLINEIGAMILNRVFADVPLLIEAFPDLKNVAINVAAPQLDGHFITLLEQQLAQMNGRDNDFIELEITETSFLEDFERVNPIFQQIKALGCRLAIDDFGTGYSSLSYLHELPIDTLKIDRSFVMRILESEKSLLMVKSIISMSLALGLEIVAEGIEDGETGQLLCDMGVQQGQGYFYHRPGFLEG